MANTYVDAATKTVDVNGTPFVYRETGEKNGIPILLLHHLTAVLDDWDPRTIDSLAQKHRVIAFNNRGVGESKGTTPDTIDAMATDAVAFIRALGLTTIDLLGFSLGGFIAQVIAQKHPDIVRKLILAATSAAGGEGVSNVAAVLQNAIATAAAEKKHPKQSLFFTQSHDGQKAAAEFLQRLATRQQHRDLPATQETIVAQVTAITKWGMSPKPASLESIQHPVLVANGDTDVMVPTINSVELARKLPHSELSIFPDAGHGAIFQYHSAFLDQTLRFLQN
ncbi:MAG: alpha/beta hydrolase [Acidobacteria bacterium]|nr:MAG: alpha/beta hydrolase [Acidobacteriota bacterium]